MKVICIGSTSKDIFFPTDEGKVVETPRDLESQKKFVFELGAKYHINDRFESLGGCAANQASGLSRLGIKSSCYTSIGDDSIGNWIKEQFSQEGIDDDLIFTEKNCLSGLSAIVVDEKSSDRIIFSNQEANEKLFVDVEKIKSADFVSVTDLSGNWKSVLEEISKISEETKIAFNPRQKNIKEDAKKVADFSEKSEIFFLNKDEAIEILDRLNIETEGEEVEIIRKIKDFGTKIAVITDGIRGAWAMSGERIFKADSIVQNRPIDSTGAGDAFSSGFMAAYLKEKSIEECLKWGIANGGKAVNFYGGVKGLLGEEEIIKEAEKVKVQKL